MVRFTAPSGTLRWVNNPQDLGFEISENTVVVEDKKTSRMALFVAVPFILLAVASIGTGFVWSGYEAYHLVTSDSVCDSRYFSEVELGGGEIFCLDKSEPTWSSTLKSVEIADQHFKYQIEDEYSSSVQEFRWSEENNVLAIGNSYSDEFGEYYICDLYVRESSLDASWTSQDLTLSEGYYRAMPSWCNETPASTSELTYTPLSEPLFEGEKLYLLMDLNYGDIWILQHTPSSLENTVLVMPYSDGILGVVLPLVFFSIFGLIFGSIGDQRTTNIIFNSSEGFVKTRKTFRGTRLSGWTWTGIDFSTMELKRYLREVHHSSGGGEDGGATEYWTTNHKGIGVSFTTKSAPLEVFFLEHGEHFAKYDSTINQLCELLNLEVPEMVSLVSRTDWESAPHRGVRLDRFPVINWASDKDARHLVSWFNDVSSREYNHSLSEALKDSGVIKVRSKQDAQALLDYLVDLLDQDMGYVADEKVPSEARKESSDVLDTNTVSKTLSDPAPSSESNSTRQESPPESTSFWNEV